MRVEDRLKADLTTAMKERDQLRTRTIRALIGVIDNAGAVDVEHNNYEVKPGLGHDVERCEVTPAQVQSLLTAERDDLTAAAREYRGLGQTSRADELERRAAIAAKYID